MLYIFVSFEVKFGLNVICTSSLAAASHVNFKCHLAPSALFVLSFKTCWYWCHFFSVLQSVRQRRGTAMKTNRLRSFSFSFVLFAHKSRRFPQSFLYYFFLAFHLSFYFSIFSLLLHIKVKWDFGLLSEYQMHVGKKKKCTTQKSYLSNCCKQFVFLS